jgi:hypothetical protein
MATEASNSDARSTVLSSPSLEQAYKSCLRAPGETREQRWLLNRTLLAAMSLWLFPYSLSLRLLEVHNFAKSFDRAYWINVLFVFVYAFIAELASRWIQNKPSHRIKFAKPCLCASLLVMLISVGFVSASIIKSIFR